MNILKKIIKIILSLILGLCAGVLILVIFQMYKPVLDASKSIDEVKSYAMQVTDQLVDKEVKVIGLGEASHGNKEFQQLKLDVLKTLIRDNGVSAIGFEMDYAEGVLINDYISGQSDMTVEELFSHISFELYHTEEIRELIEWMKEYNVSNQGKGLEFYGYDIQNPEIDLYVINQFIKDNDLDLSCPEMDAFLGNEFSFKDERMNEVYNFLSACKEEISKDAYKDYAGRDRILKCIDNVFLSKDLAAIPLTDNVAYGTYRDRAMSDNVLDISQNVGAPIMITGHNGHVGYAGSYVKTMGAYLKEVLGDDYFVIGTDYFKTKASIKSSGGRKNHTFYSADPLAYQAKKLGTYYLRFEDVKENEKLNTLITGKMPTGSLGEGYSFLNSLFAATVRVYAPVTDLYDGMIFVYKATPFTSLPY